MAEELALEERLADARTIDGNKRPIVAQTMVAKPPGNQFLARTALPFDQNTTIAAGNPIDQIQNLTNRCRNADNYGRIAR